MNNIPPLLQFPRNGGRQRESSELCFQLKSSKQELRSVQEMQLLPQLGFLSHSLLLSKLDIVMNKDSLLNTELPKLQPQFRVPQSRIWGFTVRKQ